MLLYVTNPQMSRRNAAPEIRKQQIAARLMLLALSMTKGVPFRMVSSTRLACQRMTAVQVPQAQRNTVSTAR